MSLRRLGGPSVASRPGRAGRCHRPRVRGGDGVERGGAAAARRRPQPRGSRGRRHPARPDWQPISVRVPRELRSAHRPRFVDRASGSGETLAGSVPRVRSQSGFDHRSCPRRGHGAPLSTTRPNLNPGEVGEGGVVGAHNGAACGPRGGGDDQVVRAPGPSLASDMNHQLSMDISDFTVVVQHGDDLQDVLEEGEAGCPVRARGQKYAGSELCCGDRGDGDLVVIADGVVERTSRTFGVDEKGRVEEEPGQRSSSSTTDRTAAKSCNHGRSGRCRRSSSFTFAPWPSFIGSRLATALPRRTIAIVKVKPRLGVRRRRGDRRSSVPLQSR